MSKTKEQYIDELDYLQFEEQRIISIRKEITECIQRLDDNWAQQEQLEQQENQDGQV